MPSNFRDKNGKDPFSDDEGRNPYAPDGQEVVPLPGDRQETPAAAGETPYSASAAAQYEHRVGDFEQIMPHRGVLILGVAWVGLAVGLVGIPIWYIWSIEFGVLGLAATVTACVFAAQDLRAMNLEAMDPSGRRLTAWGLFIGVIGTAVSAVSLVLLIGGIFFSLNGPSP